MESHGLPFGVLFLSISSNRYIVLGKIVLIKRNLKTKNSSNCELPVSKVSKFKFKYGVV